MTVDREQESFAKPPQELLAAYSAWLYFERRLLLMEMFPDPEERRIAEASIPTGNPAEDFHFPPGLDAWKERPQPSSRAALVLDTVGCDWRKP